MGTSGTPPSSQVCPKVKRPVAKACSRPIVAEEQTETEHHRGGQHPAAMGDDDEHQSEDRRQREFRRTEAFGDFGQERREQG